MNLQIVFVCQGGLLEHQACLLAASLIDQIKFDCRISAAIPKDQLQPASHTLDFLVRNGVELKYIENSLDEDYPIGNKLMCFNLPCANANLLFLDSDIICLRPFFEDSISFNRPFAARLTDFADLSLGEWSEFFIYLDQSIPITHRSLVSKEEMPLCFNSGVVFCQRPAQLFSKWLDYARRLNDPLRFPKTRPFLDQISLTFAVEELFDNFVELSEDHHRSLPIYPIDIFNLPYFGHYYENIYLLADGYIANYCKTLIQKYSGLRDILKDDDDLARLSMLWS